MANVTFIIGNGLDLSLGLKTSYKDFYYHVQQHNLHPKNRIYQKIKENLLTWADFEVTLGQYTQYIESAPEKDRKKESESFHEDLQEIIADLGEYLELQEESVYDLVGGYKFSLNQQGFFEELASDDQRRRAQAHLQSYPVEINLITLNYTRTLEKILTGKASSDDLGLSFQTPLHMHGGTSELLTIGVSEVSQLYTGMSQQEKNDLIKPRLIAALNDGRIEDLRRIIDSSSLIIFFGTSIGETDKYIWDYVIRWLRANKGRHIIIHKYDTNYSAKARQSPRVQRQFDNNVQDNLLKYSRLHDTDKDELRKQIFVVHNTKKLFVKLSPKPSNK
jgi:hypothetical protein